MPPTTSGDGNIPAFLKRGYAILHLCSLESLDSVVWKHFLDRTIVSLSIPAFGLQVIHSRYYYLNIICSSGFVSSDAYDDTCARVLASGILHVYVYAIRAHSCQRSVSAFMV